MDDIIVVSPSIDYDTFYDKFKSNLEFAVMRAAECNAKQLFDSSGRQIFRRDGLFTQQYNSDFNKRYEKYKDFIFNQKETFLCYLRLVCPILRESDVTCSFLTGIISDYFAKGFEGYYNRRPITISVDEISVIKRQITNDIPGCYTLHNVSKHRYYVGQSMQIYTRLSQHFSGRGCLDAYRDYESGDIFTILIFPLVSGEYDSLDTMERDLIKKYQAYEFGYNKTIGNSDINDFDFEQRI